MIATIDANGNVDVAAARTGLGKLIDDSTRRAGNTLLVVETIIPMANDGTDAARSRGAPTSIGESRASFRRS